jgi:hypothetical protein
LAGVIGSLARRSPWLALLASLAACSTVQLTENTVQAVTVHYYGVVPLPPSLDEATDIARRACAARGLNAHLRTINEVTTLDHYAHFDCVSG